MVKERINMKVINKVSSQIIEVEESHYRTVLVNNGWEVVPTEVQNYLDNGGFKEVVKVKLTVKPKSNTTTKPKRKTTK